MVNQDDERRTSVNRRTLMKLLGAASATTSIGASQAAAADSETQDTFDPIEATVSDIVSAIVDGNATAVEIVETYLKRIEVYDEALNSVINLNPNAVERAKELDRKFEESGPVGPLHGAPIVLKDNYDTGDMPTTGASLSLEETVPPDDAYMVKQLRNAGAIVIAKTNLHEFARGGETISSLGGVTRNPYELDRIPSGSSGGTAAAVAANLAVFGTGSDTGGSIRQPAAWQALVGLRPTLGLLSRDGIIPISLALDTGGYLTRTVTDTALALDATVGYDPTDEYTARAINEIPSEDSPLPEDSYTDYLSEDGLEGARIGVYREFFDTDAERVADDIATTIAEAKEETAQVIPIIEQAIEDMEELGATIIDPVTPFTIDELSELMEAAEMPAGKSKADMNNYLKSLGDASDIDSVEELVESELYACNIAESLKSVNQASTEDLETELATAIGARVALRNQVLSSMANHNLDAIVYPAIRQPPSPIGGQTTGDILNFSPEADMPAITMPAGFTEESHLPVGIELLGRRFSEPQLLSLSYAYEQGTDNRQPPADFGPLPNDPPEVEQEYNVPIAKNGCECGDPIVPEE